jgi:hypothetical protein
MNIYNLCTVCAVALYLYLLAEDRRAAAAVLAIFGYKIGCFLIGTLFFMHNFFLIGLSQILYTLLRSTMYPKHMCRLYNVNFIYFQTSKIPGWLVHSTIFQLYRSDQFYWWRKPVYPEKTRHATIH